MADNKKIRTVAVTGPTASGKTALGAQLAYRFGGEVVSADSMQIYKGMDIATAKPTEAEMLGVPHRLIGFLDRTESFSVAAYTALANEAVDEIVSRGAVPFIVGGTGLYIDALLNNTRLLDGAVDFELRETLKSRLEAEGGEALLSELRSIDSEAAAALHPNDSVRIIRALELWYSTGTTKTVQNKLSHIEPTRFEVLYLTLGFDNRELLYERINRRVDAMLKAGLLDEAREMYESDKTKTAAAAIGCKEFYPYFAGESSLEDCVEKLKRETRRYAKRQMTWFRKNTNAHRLSVDGLGNSLFDTAARLTEDFLLGKA